MRDPCQSWQLKESTGMGQGLLLYPDATASMAAWVLTLLAAWSSDKQLLSDPAAAAAV